MSVFFNRSHPAVAYADARGSATSQHHHAEEHMKQADFEVIMTCGLGAFADTVSFPETVQRLRAIGVVWYMTDLVRCTKTHYWATGESLAEPMVLDDAPAIAPTYAADAVTHALRAIQSGAIAYPAFLRQIMAAGIVGYIVFLQGNQTLYFSATGDHYIEAFPPSLAFAEESAS
jgi:uncharacterized protein YbcV (DUF1398 family)